jgi:hypothetical protein
MILIHGREHLYRRHKPEKRCPRCWTEVKDNVALREHLNQDSRCAEREAPDIECLNDHMIQKLQSKKRSRGDAKDSEAEKWREIYVLIFPNTGGQIPSSCKILRDLFDVGLLEADIIKSMTSPWP